MSNNDKILILNREVFEDQKIENITYTNSSGNIIKQKFNLGETKFEHKNSFVGIYRDIIEYVDTGEVEIRKEQNDITELFQKLLQIKMFISHGILDRLDYDRFFNMDTDDLFFQKFREIKQSQTELNFSNYLGIHSWEVGTGFQEWDRIQNWNFEYNEYGFTVRKGTVQPYSSLRIYSETLSKLNVPNELQSFYKHNSLICRTPFLNPEINNITYTTHNHSYVPYSIRKPVQTFFVVPTQYYLNENTIVTDSLEIMRKLKTGEFVPERVIEWLPYNQRNSELNFPINFNQFVVPEFIMVQQIFEPYEQNFEWREFGILQGFNITQNTLSLERSVEEPNVSLYRYMTVNGINDIFSEVEQLFYPHGTMIDYKVHQVLRKNRNMRITRQMIFGILNITSTLYQ